jgi:plasmid stabilization system protein ParE
VSKPLYRDQYLEAAIEDLIEVQGFYDAQFQQLGADFAQSVTNRVNLILEFPEGAMVFAELGVRRVKVGGFPYNIIYVLRSDIVFVVAVVHQKRHPRHWLARLELLG